MKSKTLFATLSIALLASTAMAQRATQSQQGDNYRPPELLQPVPMRNGGVAYREAVQQQDQLSNALAELKNAESESDRGKFIEKVRGLLETQYDKSLDRYEDNLSKMEERIKKMRSQVEKRRDAKADLVDLRLKMLVNEADGLGWPDGRQGGTYPAIPGAGGGGMGIGSGGQFGPGSVFGGPATPFLTRPAAVPRAPQSPEPAEPVRPGSSKGSGRN